MASTRFWAELKTTDFAGLDPNSTIAILPVAATEQHGPHLPVMTDTRDRARHDRHRARAPAL